MTEYAKSIGASEEVLNWLNTTALAFYKKRRLARPVLAEEIEHIVDWLVSGKAPSRLKRLSYADAKRLADEWSKANQKKGKNLSDSDLDLETIHDFLDGTRVVKLLTANAYKREGFLMSHCVGGYSQRPDVHIYSYRDKKNMPHATFEVQKANNEIVQIKGKGNGEIHPKYIHPILAFLKSIGMDVRPSDMKNLGYFHVAKEHVEFLKRTEAWKQVTVISGEHYAF